MSLLVVAIISVIVIVAIYDMRQTGNAVTHNFPVIGHVRALLSELGPPLRQYLFASDSEERPYNRVTRAWVYAGSGRTTLQTLTRRRGPFWRVRR